MSVASPPTKTPFIGDIATHDAIQYVATQQVIRRYWDRIHHPAGKIVGCGPETRFVGTAGTQNLSNKAIITNEGYGDGHTLPQFTSTPPAVMQPRLRRCSVLGYDDAHTGYDGTGYVKLFPAVGNAASANLYNAINFDGGGGIIDDVGVSHIPGYALYLRRPADQAITKWGDYERLRWTVERFTSYNNFAGPYIDAVDCTIHDCESVNFRDWGFRLGTASSTGAVQFDELHAFAGGLESAYGGGSAILIDGDNCQGTKSYGESAPIGLNFNGHYNTLTGFQSINCFNENTRFSGSDNFLAQAILTVGFQDYGISGHPQVCSRTMASGLLTTGDCVGSGIWDRDNTIRDTAYKFWALGTGGVGVRLQYNAGINLHLDNVKFKAFRSGGGLAGDPNGLDMQAGTFCTLTNAYIKASMLGGNIGLNLNQNNAIGVGNVIIWNTEGTRIPIQFPANQTWSTTPSSDPNLVYVNGTRMFKQ